MKFVGIINYLDNKRNEAYVNSVSKENFEEKFSFTPKKVPFKIWLTKLIVIEMEHEGKTFFSEFNVEQHQELIDLESLKHLHVYFSILCNYEAMDFIIKHQLDRNKDPDICTLRQISNLIQPFPLKPLSLDIKKLISNYRISYLPLAFNKHGDYTRGWLQISTQSPGFLLYNKTHDKYLLKLLPDFSYTIDNNEDSVKGKREVIFMMEKNRDTEEIKQTCEALTNNIKRLALFTYNLSEHTQSLSNQKAELKAKIKRKYQEGAEKSGYLKSV